MLARYNETGQQLSCRASPPNMSRRRARTGGGSHEPWEMVLVHAQGRIRTQNKYNNSVRTCGKQEQLFRVKLEASAKANPYGSRTQNTKLTFVNRNRILPPYGGICSRTRKLSFGSCFTWNVSPESQIDFRGLPKVTLFVLRSFSLKKVVVSMNYCSFHIRTLKFHIRIGTWNSNVVADMFESVSIISRCTRTTSINRILHEVH